VRILNAYSVRVAMTVFCAAGAAMWAPSAWAAQKPALWDVDDIKPGMKGQGRSVFKGTKIDTFDVEVIGVMKNVDVRRDIVLVRCSGANLEVTGVQSGMSGSPVYIDGKLLGAVAYTWLYSKIPLAGITPIKQMLSFADDLKLDPAPAKLASRELKLDRPFQWKGATYETVRFSPETPSRSTAAGAVPTLTQITTPIVTSGLTKSVVRELNDRFSPHGLMFVQGGAAGKGAMAAAADVKLEPGSAMAVALMTGDYEMAGVGTTTYVDGDRVYGWGHPFFGTGATKLVLMSGYIHTVLPSLRLSFKMGTQVKALGTLEYDTASAIIGRLGVQTPMMPISVSVVRGKAVPKRTYNVRVVREKELMPFLTFMALANTFAAEGGLPKDITIKMSAKLTFKRHSPLVIEDIYAGSSYTGELARFSVFEEVMGRLFALVDNPFEPVEVSAVECSTETFAGRRSAGIRSMRLDQSEVLPGEELSARIVLKSYKGPSIMQRVSIRIPKDTPPGRYTMTVCDARTYMSLLLGDRPHKRRPRNISQLFELLRMRAKRNRLYVYVPLKERGITVDGRELPDLPPSVLAVMAGHRRTGMGLMRNSLTAEKATDWVIQGAHRIPFKVVEEKRTQY
jgi:SpoIVB peptidase S55